MRTKGQNINIDERKEKTDDRIKQGKLKRDENIKRIWRMESNGTEEKRRRRGVSASGRKRKKELGESNGGDGGGRGRPPHSVSPSRSSKCV